MPQGHSPSSGTTASVGLSVCSAPRQPTWRSPSAKVEVRVRETVLPSPAHTVSLEFLVLDTMVLPPPPASSIQIHGAALLRGALGNGPGLLGSDLQPSPWSLSEFFYSLHSRPIMLYCEKTGAKIQEVTGPGPHRAASIYPHNWRPFPLFHFLHTPSGPLTRFTSSGLSMCVPLPWTTSAGAKEGHVSQDALLVDNACSALLEVLPSLSGVTLASSLRWKGLRCGQEGANGNA